MFGKLKTPVFNEWVSFIDIDALASVLQHSPILKCSPFSFISEDLVTTIGAEENYDPREQPFACTHLVVVNIECQ